MRNGVLTCVLTHKMDFGITQFFEPDNAISCAEFSVF